MDTYRCTCTVYDYTDNNTNIYEITRYIDARDDIHAEDLLIDWVQNIWPEADIDEITIHW